MRLLHVCCLLTLSMAWQPSLSRAADSTEDKGRPLAAWLAELSNSPKEERQQAREALDDVVMGLTEAARRERHCFELYEPVFAGGKPRPVSEQQVARWRKELIDLIPRMVEFLASEPSEEWSPVIDMLLIADPDGTVLWQQHGRLLTNSNRWSVACTTLLGTGSFVFPRDRSILAPMVEELKTLTPAKRRSLNQKLEAEASWLFGPTTAGIAIMLAQSDRVQAELPYLAVLISREQPSVLRMMSLTVLTELTEDAAPALPAIRRQLKDEDSTIRLLAAGAIAAITPKTVDVNSLATQADLQGNDLSEFREAAREYIEDAADTDEWLRSEFDEDQKQLTLNLLRSGNQFHVRQCLRTAITLESAARFAKQDIRRILKADQLDDETRRLATLAIKSIESQ